MIPLDLFKREQDRITASLETIEHRITAHHGHYAAARENLDDSLKLLSNAADIYEHADDANRRLINQALFKTIYIDEDSDGAHRLPQPVRRAEPVWPPCRRPELGRRGEENVPGRNRYQGRTLGRKFTPDPFGVSDGG